MSKGLKFLLTYLPLSFFLIISYFIFYRLTFSQDSEYYYSPDRKSVLTRLKAHGKTYFILGKYTENKKPNEYIQPIYSGVISGYETIVFWEKDTVIFYVPDGTWQIVGSPKAKVIRDTSTTYLETFHNLKDDRSGTYQHILGD